MFSNIWKKKKKEKFALNGRRPTRSRWIIEVAIGIVGETVFNRSKRFMRERPVSVRGGGGGLYGSPMRRRVVTTLRKGAQRRGDRGFYIKRVIYGPFLEFQTTGTIRRYVAENNKFARVCVGLQKSTIFFCFWGVIRNNNITRARLAVVYADSAGVRTYERCVHNNILFRTLRCCSIGTPRARVTYTNNNIMTISPVIIKYFSPKINS